MRLTQRKSDKHKYQHRRAIHSTCIDVRKRN